MLPTLIIVDMDGTSLDKDRLHMRPSTYHAIMRAISLGCQYVPATGRSLSLVPRENLPPFRYVISSNGAVVTDTLENRVVFADYFTREEGIAAWEIVQEYPLFMELFFRNKIILEKRLYAEVDRWDIPAFHRTMIKQTPPVLVDCLKEYIYHNEVGIEKLNMPRIKSPLREQYRDELLRTGLFRIPPTYDINIEATRKGADKGIAAQHLCKYLGVALKDVMAFGDDGNDVIMVGSVGCGVAIGHGHQDTIDAAKYHTEKGDLDGIAHFMADYFGAKFV